MLDFLFFADIEICLKFTTGSSTPPPTDILQLMVEMSSEASVIIASTCLLKMIIQESMADLDRKAFSTSIKTVMDGQGTAFTVP